MFLYHPEHEHKLALALAITNIFPQLKTLNSKIDGVDLLYNREQNRGYILSRLNHVRNKLYKHESESSELVSNTKSTKRRLYTQEKIKYKKLDLQVPISKNIEEQLLILKHLNVATQKEHIKEKLKITLSHREHLLKNQKGNKISIEFPFFILCPELILYDYELRYPDSCQEFIDKWPIVQDHKTDVWKSFRKPGLEFLDVDVNLN